MCVGEKRQRGGFWRLKDHIHNSSSLCHPISSITRMGTLRFNLVFLVELNFKETTNSLTLPKGIREH